VAAVSASTRDYALGFRFGFGLDSIKSFDPQAELVTPRVFNAAPSEEVKSRLLWLKERQDRVKDAGTRTEQDQKERQRFLRNHELRDTHRAIVEAAQTHAMFTFRVSAFWANHFSLGKAGPPVRAVGGLYEADALRPRLFGNFADLLIAAEFHPAMIFFLNLQESIGPNSRMGLRRGKGFNENLGREILELHTLGVGGGYTQADVIALAKILTGWHVDRRTAKVTFDKNRAEPGTKQLLGARFEGSESDAERALRLLAAHPATARHIAGKLAYHFYGPGQNEIARQLEQEFIVSKGNLAAVYRVLLDQKAAASPPTTQARSDYVFLVSALRAGNLKRNALVERPLNDGRVMPHPLTSGAMISLTQSMWLAPSPKGWRDDPVYWISPTVIEKRLKRIPILVRNFTDENPMVFADRALGPLMTANTRATLSAASSRIQAMGLALASPEFNRR
jgi:uncharacterized protein (DUF1800 family)